DAGQLVLLREGKPVALTPKVFDTLLILVENNGRIVGKDELMNRLWPDTFVELTNLTFNIKQLRKSLGDDARNPAYIETVARRGYRFIANVEAVPIESDLEPNKVTTLGGPGGESPVFTPEELPASQVEQALSLAGGSETPRPALAVDTIGGPATGPTPTGPGDGLVNSDDHGARPSATAGRNRILFRAALITAIAAAFFFFWKYSSGSARNAADRARLARETGSPSPLKLE